MSITIKFIVIPPNRPSNGAFFCFIIVFDNINNFYYIFFKKYAEILFIFMNFGQVVITFV